MIIFEGFVVDKKLLFIKVDDYYFVCWCILFVGFLDKFYFCYDCNKGYNIENYCEYFCDKLWCNVCK